MTGLEKCGRKLRKEKAKEGEDNTVHINSAQISDCPVNCQGIR